MSLFHVALYGYSNNTVAQKMSQNETHDKAIFPCWSFVCAVQVEKACESEFVEGSLRLSLKSNTGSHELWLL